MFGRFPPVECGTYLNHQVQDLFDTITEYQKTATTVNVLQILHGLTDCMDNAGPT